MTDHIRHATQLSLEAGVLLTTLNRCPTKAAMQEQYERARIMDARARLMLQEVNHG